MPEIPPLPAPPESIRPTCERCTKRGAAARTAARGNGTPAAIRLALDILDEERRSGVPLGETVKIDGVYVCPRCTRGEGGRPLNETAVMNRRARRKMRIR